MNIFTVFPQHHDLFGNDRDDMAAPPLFAHILESILSVQVGLWIGIGRIARTIVLDENSRKKEDEDDDAV